MKKAKEKVKKSYVIFGVGKFGRSVAESLCLAGHNVLAVDKNKDKVNDIAPYVTMAAVADICDAMEMQNLGLGDFDAAIIATTDDLSASVMGIMLCKEAGIPFIIAKAYDERQARLFEKIGANKTIIPENDAAIRITHTILNNDYQEVYELSDDIYIAEIQIKKEWQKKTLKELDLRNRYSLNVAAVRHNGKLFNSWGADEPLPDHPASTIIIIVNRKTLDELIED